MSIRLENAENLVEIIAKNRDNIRYRWEIDD